jgi:hypothetical protein
MANPFSGYPFHGEKTDGWSIGDRDTIRRLGVQMPGSESRTLAGTASRRPKPPILLTEELRLP